MKNTTKVTQKEIENQNITINKSEHIIKVCLKRKITSSDDFIVEIFQIFYGKSNTNVNKIFQGIEK